MQFRITPTSVSIRQTAPAAPVVFRVNGATFLGSGTGGASINADIKTVTETGYALVASDAGKYLRFTANSAVALVVPSDAEAELPIGFQVMPYQGGTGTVSFAPTPGVTINTNGDLALRGQNSSGALVKVGPNSWDLVGDLAGDAPIGASSFAALTGQPGDNTALAAALAGKADEADLNNYATTSALSTGLAGKAATSHTHVISDVTGLQGALDAKQPLGTYANATHNHDALYAPLSHTHAISSVPGLQAALDAKADDTDLTNLATTSALTSGLAGKQNSNANLTSLAALAATAGNAGLVIKVGASGGFELATDISATGGSGAASWGSISGTLSSQTDLQSALNAKASSTHNHDTLYAALNHTHTTAQVTGLDTALSGKAALTGGNAFTGNQGITGNLSVDGVVTIGRTAGAPLDSTVGFNSNNFYHFWTFTRWEGGAPVSQGSLQVGDTGMYWGGQGHHFRKSDGTEYANFNATAATFATPLSGDQGGQTNVPALGLSNIGLGTSGIHTTYTSGGYADFLHVADNKRIGYITTNRGQMFQAISNAYDDSGKAFEFLNSGADARHVIAAKQVDATATGDFFRALDSSDTAKLRITSAGGIVAAGTVNAAGLQVSGTNVSLQGHTHAISDVTGLQSALDAKQAAGSYAAASHTHTIANVTGLQSALDGKQAAGSYQTQSSNLTSLAALAATAGNAGLVIKVGASGGFELATDISAAGGGGAATWGAISGTLSSQTDLQSALNAKANSTHTHAQSDITNLVSDLAAKAPKAAPTFTGTLTADTIIDLIGSPTGNAVVQHSGGIGGALVLQNTGGTYGTSRLTLMNEGGKNGAIFETQNATADLVDFIFKSNSGSSNIRYERRPSYLAGAGVANHGSFVFTFGDPDAPTVKIGDAGLVTSNLQASGNLDVTGALTKGGTAVSLTGHTHTIGDVTGLQSALDAKQAAGSYAAATHTHAYTDINNVSTGTLFYRKTAGTGAAELQTLATLKTDLALTKADVGLGNVTNVAQQPLDADLTAIAGLAGTSGFLKKTAADTWTLDTTSYQIAGSYAAASHTHVIADVTGLQTALNAKEGTIAAGTTGQYWRGDKSWQTLDKSAVGLSNVDNTSDANKPVSTAVSTALAGKQNSHANLTSLSALTTTGNAGLVIKVNAAGNGFELATDLSAAGGAATWGGITGTLSNQTDLQNALNAKAPLSNPAFTGSISLYDGEAGFYVEPGFFGVDGYDGAYTTFNLNSKGNFSGSFLNIKRDGLTKGWFGYGNDNKLKLQSSDIVYVDGNNGVALSYLNATKLAVVNTGVNVTGTLAATGAVTGSNLSGTNTGDETYSTITSKLAAGSGGGTANFLRADGTFAAPPAGGGSSAWGSITGTLSSQTDLQNAFNAKLDKSGGTITGTLSVNAGIDINKTTGAYMGTIAANETTGALEIYAAQGGKFYADLGYDFKWGVNNGITLTVNDTGAAVTGTLNATGAITQNGTAVSLAGHTHADATTSVSGFMSAADKTKLNGIATGATANTGTVTTVSVTSANGISGTVTNAGTTPAISLSLGAITPTSVTTSGNIVAQGTANPELTLRSSASGNAAQAALRFEDSTSTLFGYVGNSNGSDNTLYVQSGAMLDLSGQTTVNVNATNGVIIQHGGSTRLSTSTTGVAVTGNISAANHLTTMSGFCSGKPASLEAVAGAIFPVATTITQANCQAIAVDAATASPVFTIKNKTAGTTVGTITFAAGATLATVSITSGAVAANAMLYIEAPSTADATLANIAFLVRA